MVRHLVLAIAAAAILSCGQNEPLAQYEPQSPQEQALKRVLLDFQDGVNTKDSKKVADLIHENAAIMTGRDRKIMSKADYLKILPKRLAENPSIVLGKPKISLDGDKAEVKIYMTRGDLNVLVVYDMRMEGHQWYIYAWKY
ncbi:MAG: nuclear transport factor 2 family protein [Desulfobacterales bacterium]|nr:nuclear transport factor 2 family protein [Desulfobacterales bacterium]